jgi:hypothetical protein
VLANTSSVAVELLIHMALPQLPFSVLQT